MAAGQPGSLCGPARDATKTLTSFNQLKKPGAVSRPGANRQFQFNE
jgi:hypothetical protein